MIITIIYIIGVSWFVTQLDSMINALNDMTKGHEEAFLTLLGLASCIKCLTFWTALIVTFNFPLACVASLVAYLIDSHLLSTDIKL